MVIFLSHLGNRIDHFIGSNSLVVYWCHCSFWCLRSPCSYIRKNKINLINEHALYNITSTVGTSILRMVTVMNFIPIVSTIIDTRFSSSTAHIIEDNISTASSKTAPRCSALSISIPHTPADNVSVVQVPVVIAHSPPRSAVENFYSARPVGVSIFKSCFWIS